jgi:hypothetical protein
MTASLGVLPACNTEACGLSRLKVEDAGRRLGFQLRDRRLRAIIAHGVVSTGARTPDRLGFNAPKGYATLNSNQTSDRPEQAGAAETAR